MGILAYFDHFWSRMGKQLLYFISILLGQAIPLGAQTVPVDTLRVRVIAQEQGLSQLNALSIDFDSLGHVWIGTQNGLNRYNGQEMKVYRATEGQGMLQDDHIRDLFLANDTLWLATNTHSVNAYLPREDRFISFGDSLNVDRYPQLKFAHTIIPLDKGHLLLGTVDHVVLIDRKNLDFKIFPISEEMEGEYLVALEPFGENSFLLGSNYNRSFLFDLDSLTLKPFNALKESANTFFNIDSRRMLVGTNKGLFIFYKQDGRLERVPKPGGDFQINRIFPWGHNTFFIGGTNQSFLLEDLQQWRELAFTDHSGKSIQSTVLSLNRDPQGGVWMGTDGRGVWYHHPRQEKFVSHRIKVQNAPKRDFISIFNFLKEGDTLWMATEFGLARYQFGSQKYSLYLTDHLDYTLAKDSVGGLWAGGFGDGLMKYDRKLDRFENISLPINDDEVIQITPVSRDSLWIHTWSSGIHAFNIHDHGIKRKIVDGKSLMRSRNSLIDSQGAIWLASDDGFYRFHRGKETSFDSLSNPRVFAITEDPGGNIWVGTGKGLNRIEAQSNKITHYIQQEGLPNDFIYGVESDDHGNIWVSTNYGLSQLIMAEQRFKNYTQRDGLQNDEFNGKASYKDQEGRLYFGGMNGFNIFHPDSIPINRKIGKTVVEGVALFGMPLDVNVPYTDHLVFSHEQNVISFNFASLNYLWPEKNRFRFMLEGFDKDWRPVTKESSTTYTNLDPGSYTFRVMGSNNEMIWGAPTELPIVIKSPWYSSVWFKGALIGLLVLLTLGFLNYRDNRQRKRTEHLAQVVQERTLELTGANQALNDSLVLSNKQKENISFLMQELNHRVKNNLQLIISLIDFQNMDEKEIMEGEQLKQLQYRVFTVAKIHDMLAHGEVFRDHIKIDGFIEKLARELIEFSGIPIDLELDIIPLELPSNKLTYLGLILNELITNSIKHAFSGEGAEHPALKIYLGWEDGQLKFEYRDNGKGMHGFKGPKTGNRGMNLIQILTQELKGTFETKTQQGAVFTFYFELPSPNKNGEKSTDPGR